MTPGLERVLPVLGVLIIVSWSVTLPLLIRLAPAAYDLGAFAAFLLLVGWIVLGRRR